MMKSMLAAIVVAAVVAPFSSSDHVLTGHTYFCPGGSAVTCVKTGDMSFKIRHLTVTEALSGLSDE